MMDNNNTELENLTNPIATITESIDAIKNAIEDIGMTIDVVVESWARKHIPCKYMDDDSMAADKVSSCIWAMYKESYQALFYLCIPTLVLDEMIYTGFWKYDRVNRMLNHVTYGDSDDPEFEIHVIELDIRDFTNTIIVTPDLGASMTVCCKRDCKVRQPWER